MKRALLVGALLMGLIPTLASAQWYGGTAGVTDAGQGTGAGWLDYDQDGRLDIFSGNFNGTTVLSRQFAGNVWNNFASGVLAQTGPVTGVNIIDVDNDGTPEIYITRDGAANTLLTQVALSSYSDITTPVLANGTARSMSSAWADYDQDGDLDLYIVNQSPDPCVLLRNDAGTFVDVTPAVLSTLAASQNAYWVDYDNDGDMDLHRVNGLLQDDNLFRNNGGGLAEFFDANTFSFLNGIDDDGDGVIDEVDEIGAELQGTGNGSSACWGDFDNDGWLDVFLTNEWDSTPFDTNPNLLMRNVGDGTFTPATTGGMLNIQQINRGCAWLDYDNDGDLDLYIVKSAANEVHRNDGAGVFVEMAGGIELNAGNGFSAITADYDSDGDVDMYVTNSGANILLRNDNPAGNWLHMDLDGVFSNRGAVGARVAVTQGAVTQIREVSAGTGYASSNDYRVTFGLPTAQPVTVTVDWPSGAAQVLPNVAVDQLINITEPGGNFLDVTNGEPVVMSNTSNRGVTWADYDRDGDLDAYVAIEANGPDRLLRNDGPGVGFVDVTSGPLLTTGAGACALFADVDNDGYPDLILGDYAGVKVMLNDTLGGWTNITAFPLGVDRGTLALAVADYDNDGDLDLFLGNSNFTDSNQLMQNDGTGVFTEVTPPELVLAGSTQAACWGDIDDDGDQDLFVARSGDANALYENQGGIFTDITDPALADPSGSAVGAEFIDYNNDGTLDLYLTRQQDSNSLYLGDGTGGFVEVLIPGASGVATLTTSWGDFDLDGDLDFYQPSGGGTNALFRNDGTEFVNVALYPETDAGGLGLSQGGAWADIDDDGDLDYLMTGQSQNRLIQNVAATGNWLRVTLQGVESNHDGIGARVRVFSTSGTQIREVKAQAMRGSEPAEAHFGLGTDNGLVTIQVEWPSGRFSQVSTVINTENTVVEPGDFTAGNWPSLADAGTGRGATLFGEFYTDVYLSNAGDDNAYLQYQEGVYQDITDPDMVLNGEVNNGPRAGDYDNDGDLDIFVPSDGGNNHLFRNDLGNFVDVASGLVLGSGASAAWADVDNDGDLDLFIANLGPNQMLRNDGGVFVDYASGEIDQPGGGFTRGGSFGDFDNDGDQDLYLCQTAADDNQLLRNDGGVFVDVTTPTLADNGRPAHSAAWGDFDNDFDLDLYVTNVGDTSRLFRNDGAGVFVDVATAPINNAGNSLDASWGDYDNDGDLDLYVARSSGQQNSLYRNEGGEAFVDMAASIVDLQAPEDSRGASWGDFNQDGLLDLYVVNQGANSLLENTTLNAGNFLRVKLEGTISNRDGNGARVRLKTVQPAAVTPDGLAAAANANNDQIREKNTDHGSFSQNSDILHFGVGQDFIIDFLEVTWPSGIVQNVTGANLGETVTVVEQAAPEIHYATPNTSRPDTDGFNLIVHGTAMTVDASPFLYGGSPVSAYPANFYSTDADTLINAEFNLLPLAPGSYNLHVPTPGGDLILANALVIYTEASDLTRLTTDSNLDFYPVFSPDGQDIAFTSNRFAATYVDLTIKGAAAPDVGTLPRLTAFSSDTVSPSYSPDGSTIVISNSASQLHLINVDTEEVSLLFPNSAVNPTWSPLGDRIAFAYFTAGQQKIYLIDPDGNNLTQLTNPPPGATDGWPAWSPDGNQVLFTRSPDGQVTSGIYAVPALGGEAAGFEVILPNDGTGNFTPKYSPDGQWIAYWTTAGYNVWVMSSRGPEFGQYQISADPSFEAFPNWSPDGTQLAFTSTRSGSGDVYVATNMPFQLDTDGDLVPNSVDACPLDAPMPGEVDRDFDGCPDPTSSFRFVEFWSDDQLPVRYETDAVGDPNIADGSDFSALVSAFAAWVSVGNVVLSGGDDMTRTGPSNAVSGDGRNSITFSDGDGFLPGILAITPSTSAVSDTFLNGRWYRPGEMIDADMLFNTAQFTFSTPSSPGPAGSFDLRALATHEFGHFFGLSHSSLSASTMFYVVSPGTSQQSPEQDDISLVRRAYFGTSPALSIEGTVFDSDGSTPVVGAALFAVSEATGDTLQMTLSGPDGVYRFFELGEVVKVWTHPLDGSSEVNGMIPGIINPTLAAAANVLFLPEYFDGIGETNVDFGAPGVPVNGITTPFLGADIILNQDQTGPVVLSSTPADLDSNVQATTSILVRFDEAVSPASISGNFSLTLQGGGSVSGGGALLEGSTLLVVTPDAPLQYSATYDLVISTGITDVFGNPLQAPYAISFSTEAQPPVTITSFSPPLVSELGALIITGTGFDPIPGNNLIQFSGGFIPATSATPTQLNTVVPVGTLSDSLIVLVNGVPSNALLLTVLPPKGAPAGNPVDVIPVNADPRDIVLTPNGASAYIAVATGVAHVNAAPSDPGFKTLTNIAIAGGTVGVTALPDGQRVLAVGATNPRLTSISSDPSNLFNQVLQTASLLDEPLGVVAVPGGSRVAIAYTDRVALVEAASGASFGSEVRTWPTGGGFQFTGEIVVSASAQEIYATTNAGEVAVLGLGAGEGIVTMLMTGPQPSGVAPAPDGSRVYAVDGLGTLSEFAVRGPFVKSKNTAPAFSDLAVSPEGRYAFASNFTLNTVNVFDLTTTGLSVVETFNTGIDPRGIVLSPSGRYVYVITGQQDLMEVFDTESGPRLLSLSPSSGGTGTLVTLAGSGFDPVPTNNLVTFGGASATVMEVSSGGLVVAQPAGASSGAVQVSVNAELSNTLQYLVTNRANEGTFQLGPTIPTTSSQLMRMFESPSGKLLVGMGDTGALHVLGGDPSGPNFLREIQVLTDPDIAVSGEVVFTPDGTKAYVFGALAGGVVVVFDVNEGGTGDALTRTGVIGGGTPIIFNGPVRLTMHPDGTRLFVSDGGTAAVRVVDVATGLVSSLLGGYGNLIPMAVHPDGMRLFVGNDGSPTPSVDIVDIDPTSITFGTVLTTAASNKLNGPYQIVPSTDGQNMFVVTGDVAGLSEAFTVERLDADQASGTYASFTEEVFIGNDVTTFLQPNRTGSVLYVMTSNVGGGIEAIQLEPGFSPGGSVFATGFSMAGNIALSRDDARIYSAGFGGLILTTNAATVTGVLSVSGTQQTAVANQMLPAPIVMGVTAAQQSLATGALVEFNSPNGDFGAGDGRFFAAADASGHVATSFTPGAVNPATINVISPAGPVALNLTVVADTTAVPPEILGVEPTSNQIPGVTTVIAVKFSKAVNPATITPATYFLRPVGGSALPGVFGFTDGGRRVTFLSNAALQVATDYEIVVTTGVQDFSANPLTAGGVFSFTTEAPVPLALSAIDPPSGKKGTPVVLSGQGFGATVADNKVLFGAVEAYISNADPRALTVLVPSGAVTGDVQVVVGSSSSNTKPFTVLETPPDPVGTTTTTLDMPSSGQDIVITPDGTRAYMASPGANSVVPILVSTETVEPAVPVGLHPFGVATSPSGDRLYTTNYFSNNISVMDSDPLHGTFQQVVATIPTGLNPTGVVSHPDGRTLYVVNYGDSTLSVVDTDSTSATYNSGRASIRTDGGSQAVDVTPDGGRLLVGTSEGFLIFDTNDFEAGRASIRTDGGSQSIDVTPDGGLAVVLTTNGYITVVDILEGSPTYGAGRASIRTDGGGQSIDVSPDGGFVYVTTSGGTVDIYKLTVSGGSAAIAPNGAGAAVSLTFVLSVEVGENPVALAFDPSGSGLVAVVNAGSQTVTFLYLTDIPPVIEVLTLIEPGTFNMNSNGKFVSATIQPPAPYVPEDVEPSTVRINGVVEPDLSKTSYGDNITDGIPDVTIKFPRQAVFAALGEGQQVPITVTGMIDGQMFTGVDTVKVLRPKIKEPKSGQTLVSGVPFLIEWESSQAGQAELMDIFWSSDAGETWHEVVTNTADDNSEEWMVPEVTSIQCQLLIVAKEQDGTMIGSAMVPGPFKIGSTLGLPDVPLAFMLHQAMPNPFSSSTQVRFELPEASSVLVQIFGVDGGLVRTLAQSAEFKAGRHALPWDGRDDRGQVSGAGVYFIRIQAGEDRAVRKVIRIR